MNDDFFRSDLDNEDEDGTFDVAEFEESDEETESETEERTDEPLGEEDSDDAFMLTGEDFEEDETDPTDIAFEEEEEEKPAFAPYVRGDWSAIAETEEEPSASEPASAPLSNSFFDEEEDVIDEVAADYSAPEEVASEEAPAVESPVEEVSAETLEEKTSDEKDDKDHSVSSDLIRGHINTIILRSLYDGDKYGYEIIAEIERKSHKQYSLKQPSLYSALKRLEKDGYVTSYWGGSVSGGRRKYFSLTDEGKSISERNQSEWEYSRTVIDSLISDKDYDFTAPAPAAVDMRVLKKSTSRIPGNREDEEFEYDEPFEPMESYEPVEEASISESETISPQFDAERAAFEEERARFEESLRQREEMLRIREEAGTRREQELLAREFELQAMELRREEEEQQRLEEQRHAEEAEAAREKLIAEAAEREAEAERIRLAAEEAARQAFEEEQARLLAEEEAERIRREEEQARLLEAEAERMRQAQEQAQRMAEIAETARLEERERILSEMEAERARQEEENARRREEEAERVRQEQEQAQRIAEAEENARIQERNRIFAEMEAERVRREEAERIRIAEAEAARAQAEAARLQAEAEIRERQIAEQNDEIARTRALALNADKLQQNNRIQEMAPFTKEREQYEEMLRRQQEEFERYHSAQLAEVERRVRQEDAELYRRREQDMIHQNYISLVKGVQDSPSQDIYSSYYYGEKRPGDLDPFVFGKKPEEEREYRSAIQRILFSTIREDEPQAYPPAPQPTEEPLSAPSAPAAPEVHEKPVAENSEKPTIAVKTVKTADKKPKSARSLDGIDFYDLEARAAQDGIRITLSGGRKTKELKSKSDSLVHKGRALFFSALVVFLICFAEGSLTLGFRKTFNIPVFYTIFFYGTGLAALLITGLLFMNRYGEHALRQTGSLIANVILVYALSIVIILIVALARQIDFGEISDLMTNIIIPAIFFFNIIIFGLAYYLQIRPNDEN